MGEIRLTAELRERGVEYADLRRMTGTGEVRRVRRGAYADPVTEKPEARLAHLEVLRATMAQSSPETVASHISAAAVHGLPLWESMLSRVQLTRDRAGGLKQRRYSVTRGLPLDAADVVVVDGIPVTSIARTVLDLGCLLPMRKAVAVGDAALRAGLTQHQIEAALERARRRHGIGQARQSLRFLDGRAESVGESTSRVVFFELGLPKPELQVEVRDAAGRLLGRCDFEWEEFDTVGEFDGRVKYGRLLKPGQQPEDVVWEEKRREDAIRGEGRQMVRWVNDDLYPPTQLVARLRAAFARGRRAA